MNAMSRSTRNWLLSGILIIAIFLRFYHFTSTPPGLYPDEAINGNDAVAAAETGHFFQVFYPDNNGREGLYNDILALILKAWPVYEPWVLRIPAAIAGVLTVWGLYLLAAELFGDGTGLLAAFLLATSVWHIIFSRIAFRAILSPLLLVWAVWLLVKAFRQPPSSRAWWYIVTAAIVYSLGLYTYIAYRITALLLLVFIPFFRSTPQFWRRTLVFFLVAVAVFAPLGWYFTTVPGSFFGRTMQIAVTSAANPAYRFAANLAKEALMFNVHGDNNWRQNVSGAPELFWPVGILFLLGLGLGAYSLFRRARKNNSAPGDAAALFPSFGLSLSFAWLALGILPAAASDEGIPHALRSILAIPPAMIFAALGGVWLYRLIKDHWHKRVATGIATVFLFAVAAFAYYDYFVAWAGNPNVPGAFSANYVEIGDSINALPSSTMKYVIVNAGGVPVNGIPMPAETTMFISHSFTTADAAAAHIRYLLPGQTNEIPAGTPRADIFSIN